MSRIFTIRFSYSEQLYEALVSLKGSGEALLKVTRQELHILLPHGNLTVPLSHIVTQLAASGKEKDQPNIVYVADSISIQLLSGMN